MIQKIPILLFRSTFLAESVWPLRRKKSWILGPNRRRIKNLIRFSTTIWSSNSTSPSKVQIDFAEKAEQSIRRFLGRLFRKFNITSPIRAPSLKFHHFTYMGKSNLTLNIKSLIEKVCYLNRLSRKSNRIFNLISILGSKFEMILLKNWTQR